MKIFLTGASGFVGQAIAKELKAGGHEVVALARTPESASRILYADRVVIGNPAATGKWQDELALCDGCVNLAGEPMNEKWSAEKKRKLRESRVASTKNIVDAIDGGKPFTLFCASAIGIYRDGGEAALDENAPLGDNFLARLAIEWEEEAKRAAQKGAKVIVGRFGLVLGMGGGALPPLVKTAQKAMKVPEGKGEQWMSWIDLHDLARAIRHLLESGAAGTFNLCAPNPVRQREFTAQVERLLGPPARLRPLSPAVRLLFGEMADLVLFSHRASAAKLESTGFKFENEEVDVTLAKILS